MVFFHLKASERCGTGFGPFLMRPRTWSAASPNGESRRVETGSTWRKWTLPGKEDHT